MHRNLHGFSRTRFGKLFFVSVKKRVSSDKAEWRIGYLGDQPSGCIEPNLPDIAYCYRILPIQSP